MQIYIPLPLRRSCAEPGTFGPIQLSFVVGGLRQRRFRAGQSVQQLIHQSYDLKNLRTVRNNKMII